jgi:hypothetical protein
MSSTAQLFVGALATLPALLRAGAVWLLLLCGVAGLAVYAACVVAWCGCRWVWRAVRGIWAPAVGPEGGSGLPGDLRAAPEPAETPSGRPGPSRARGDTDDRTEIEEAA